MRINRNAIQIGLLCLGLALFFGYVAYRDLVYDKASAAEQSIIATVAAYEKKQPDVPARPPEYYGAKRAELALAEYRLGVVESTRGCNCGPIVDKYTEGHRAQWCTMFASWIAKEAGSPLVNEKNGSWKILNSRDFAANLQKNGTWYGREEVLANNIQPRTGDFMVFWRGDYEGNLGHVDIVIDAQSDSGTAGLLGGNLKDKVQYRDFPYLNFYGFLGFGRPEKE